MPTRTDAPQGAPIWVDLQTTDAMRARRFYAEVLGWDATEPIEQFGGYFNYLHDGTPIAGGCACDPSSPFADRWTTYLASSDARATAAAATRHGGRVLVEPMDVADLGTMSILEDASGAAVGVWEPKQHRGFLTHDEPGTPAWFDLESRAFAANVEFYEQVFGWTTHPLGDSDDFRYTTLQIGDTQYAGIMDAAARLGPTDPVAWTPVFRVSDTDATVARATSLGGAVVRPAADAPWGRLATLTDPNGARLALISAG